MTRVPGAGSVRLLVVDDSATIRMALVRLLGRAAPDCVVADAADARTGIGLAAAAVQRAEPFDLVLLDVEMPGISGLEAVPRLLELRPPPRILMVASPTRRSAEITFAALRAGASDFVPKPSSHGLAGFERELLGKVRALLPRPPAARHGSLADSTSPPARPARLPAGTLQGAPAVAPNRRMAQQGCEPQAIVPSVTAAGTTRRRATAIVAVGASTGGPAAVSAVLRGLRDLPPIPIIITQHMPAPFLPVFAEQLGPLIGRPCSEAAHGEVLQSGRIYIAPGEHHLVCERVAHHVLLRLDAGPPEHFCRPAVDPMLRSVARAFGPSALAVILTGMGQDGAEGCAAVRAAGGRVLAQDEATSVVWGMPGAVVRRGLADAVLPLDAIAAAILASARAGARSP